MAENKYLNLQHIKEFSGKKYLYRTYRNIPEEELPEFFNVADKYLAENDIPDLYLSDVRDLEIVEGVGKTIQNRFRTFTHVYPKYFRKVALIVNNDRMEIMIQQTFKNVDLGFEMKLFKNEKLALEWLIS